MKKKKDPNIIKFYIIVDAKTGRKVTSKKYTSFAHARDAYDVYVRRGRYHVMEYVCRIERINIAEFSSMTVER